MTNGKFTGARLATALTVLATLLAPAAASAQIQQVSSSGATKQTVNFTFGYFTAVNMLAEEIRTAAENLNFGRMADGINHIMFFGI